MKSLILTSATLLAACVSSAETCDGYGFKPGTDGYANCMMQVEASNSQRRQAVAQYMRSTSPSLPSPRITTCRPIAGGMVQCY